VNDEADREGRDRRFWALAILAGLVFVAVWLATVGATPTHDEAVYLDVADHPFTSSLYPGDTFLRHPPLGLALLGAWTTLGLAARAWPLVWTLAGLGVLADGLRRREGSPAWLLGPVLAAPVAVPLTTVTLYPPLFFFLAVVAWAWATGRRDVEVVAWNLAVFVHELALLLLAVLLATRAIGYLRDRVDDWHTWARLVWPYPAALVWGTIMLAHLLAGDGRGDYLATITDPSPNVAAILGLKPWAGLVLLATLAPFLVDPRRTGSRRDAGLGLAGLVAAVASPFYRYALPLVPLLVVRRGIEPPTWWERWGPTPLLAGALLVSGLALGTAVTGHDTLNAANLPGLVDHEEASELVGPREHVVVRSSPSFARALAADGWTITGTAPTGPATVELARGNETIVLHRAETYERLRELDRIDAIVVPATWTNVPDELPVGTWTKTDEAGSATRWEPTTAPR